MTAFVKSTEFETFKDTAGTRIGFFSLEDPIPWLPMESKLDPKGKKIYFRIPPIGTSVSKDNRSINYHPPPTRDAPGDSAAAVQQTVNLSRKVSEKQTEKLSNDVADDVNVETNNNNADKNDQESVKNALEVIYQCPEPEIGLIVIVFNFKLANKNSVWQQLRYSLKESPIRMGQYAEGKEGKSKKNKFNFNQEERHSLFWEYIKKKEWKLAASFVDREVSEELQK